MLGDGDVSSTIGLFLISAMVLVAAYYTTRFLSIKTRRLGKGANMEMVNQLYLARDKHIMLLKVGEKGYIVGVTNQAITLIGTLETEEMQLLMKKEQPIRESSGGGGTRPKFWDLLKKFVAAPDSLHRARRQAGTPKTKENREQNREDDLDLLISAVKNKKDHFGGGNRKNGDQP